MNSPNARFPFLDEDRLLTSGEVAAIFRVDAKTVARWAAQGRLASTTTPGGHRRYHPATIRAALNPTQET